MKPRVNLNSGQFPRAFPLTHLETRLVAIASDARHRLSILQITEMHSYSSEEIWHEQIQSLGRTLPSAMMPPHCFSDGSRGQVLSGTSSIQVLTPHKGFALIIQPLLKGPTC